MRLKNIVKAVLAIAIVMAFGSELTYATSLSLRYRVNGGAWTQIDDNTLGDLSSTSGVILVSKSSGIWKVVVEAGQGGTNTNDPSFPLPNLNLDLSSNVTLTNGGTGTLEVQLSQKDLTPAADGWNLQWAPTFSGTGLSATVVAYADDSNTLFGTSQLIKSFGPVSTGGAYSGTGYVTVGVPYSLTVGIIFNAVNASRGAGSAGDQLIAPVSEPGSLMLLGASLISWAAVKRRRG